MDVPKDDSYHHELESLRRQSPILSQNTEGRNAHWVGWRRSSADQLASLIKDYEKSILVGLHEQIRQVKIEFDNYATNTENAGRGRPTEMPARMQEKFDNLRAREEIAKHELKEIQAVFDRRVAEAQESVDAECLHHGPRGCGKMLARQLVCVDGQKVSRDSEGVLRISDKRSQYNGMRCDTYYERIVRPWKAERAKRNRHLAQEAASQGLLISDLRKHGAPWPEPIID